MTQETIAKSELSIGMASFDARAPAAEATTSKSRTIGERIDQRFKRFLSVAVFILAWHLFTVANNTWLHAFNPMMLPSPVDVFWNAVELADSGKLWRDIAASLSRVVQGFLLAAIFGVVCGMLVATWKGIATAIEPIIELLRPIPPLAFLPLMVLWFGIGEMSKIVFIAYAAFFPIFTTTVEGIRSVDPVLQRAALALGTSRWQLFRFVIMPASMPGIITGLRLSFALSFFVIVAAEFIAANSGLGYLINDARTFFLVSQMFVGAAAIGFIGFVFNTALKMLENRVLSWRDISVHK